ncbi:RecQ family ATP-dependent DNA helicase [Rhodococcus chondri]|uniref:ATP-dependent DNA helicase RecQ n=1 Tax=Rhodococcus chondri TaxID=3065941 RepID=A0ABU7JPM2_9NOCA|nr:ATP-dependent DNA helicase RecQ [Rhodococcus sp. CC-R104]MEE2031968.1 ATP-dependent DNA helicase RecQ [Rhodococcus sp. CC-R104]
MSASTSRTRDPRRELQDTALRVFGWDSLRREQLDAMVPLLHRRDVLAVMATGSGKSAIYQVPSVLLPGATVVVSPLIALQNDQIAGLDTTDAPGAVAINSRQSAPENETNWQAVLDHNADYVFLAPEQLAKDDVLERLAAAQVSLVVVDEAHCVSAWGHDFRPEYLRLADALERLGRPPVVALTATASPPVREEIVSSLRLRDPVIVAGGFDRPNLDIAVERHTDDAEKRRAVVDKVLSLQGPGLVYASTRKDTERYAAELSDMGLRACAYHAGLSAGERSVVHERFLDGECDVVVATSAFGMGIDKPDVRFVVHAAVPDSIDSYYQQIGRAGRDGDRALALLFYRSEDLSLATFFTTYTPDEELVSHVFAALRNDGPKRLKQLRSELGVRGRKLTNAVNLLERAGAITSGRKGFSATALSPRDALARAKEVAAAGERMDRSRVDMMRGYAETRGCRRQFLLGYFGEELADPCGSCDNCRDGVADEQEPTSSGRTIVADTRVVHREWGPGVVMTSESDRITVLFESQGYRTLALETVAEAGLLTTESGAPIV